MKKLFWALAVLCFLSLASAKEDTNKLWITGQTYRMPDYSTDGLFYFVQDKETGTRCYAFQTSYGAGINCVPAQH